LKEIWPIRSLNGGEQGWYWTNGISWLALWRDNGGECADGQLGCELVNGPSQGPQFGDVQIGRCVCCDGFLGFGESFKCRKTLIKTTTSIRWHTVRPKQL